MSVQYQYYKIMIIIIISNLNPTMRVFRGRTKERGVVLAQWVPRGSRKREKEHPFLSLSLLPQLTSVVLFLTFGIDYSLNLCL